MKKLFKRKAIVIMAFAAICFTSCSTEADRVIGVEISGTFTLNGTYMKDENHTKGPKFVNIEDSSKRLITYMDGETEMWGLMRQNYLVYKIATDGEIPPEEQWECGVGVDKDKFRCISIFGK